MKNRKNLIPALLLLLLVLSPLMTLSSPESEFHSDEFIGKAIAKIGEMDIDELGLFIDYLASCTAVTKSEIQKFNCEKDRAIFEIKYIKRNELTSLMSTLQVVEMRIGHLSDSDAGTDDRKEMTTLLFRSIDVVRRLRDTASIYYAVENRENSE